MPKRSGNLSDINKRVETRKENAWCPSSKPGWETVNDEDMVISDSLHGN